MNSNKKNIIISLEIILSENIQRYIRYLHLGSNPQSMWKQKIDSIKTFWKINLLSKKVTILILIRAKVI